MRKKQCMKIKNVEMVVLHVSPCKGSSETDLQQKTNKIESIASDDIKTHIRTKTNPMKFLEMVVMRMNAKAWKRTGEAK